MYQKEIIYMGLHKDGSRLGSAGFLKVESREKESSMYLKIKNIPHSISGRFPVRFYNGVDWKEVDGITLQEGSGLWEEKEPESLKQVRLQIILPGGYLIEGISKHAQQKLNERRESGLIENGRNNSIQMERAVQEETSKEITAEGRGAAGRENVAGEAVNQDAAREESVNKEDGKRNMSEESRDKGSGKSGLAEESWNRDMSGESLHDDAGKRDVPEESWNQDSGKRDLPEGSRSKESKNIGLATESREIVERIPVQKQRRSAQETIAQAPVMVSEELPQPMADKMQIDGIKEDKWEQILDTYDQIHPYGDERVYVKLEPKDFVILQAKYQHLVNNSFLLHGFYNYRYVILGKENDFYLGVPGVYYEREKMVALMFGFEAFECQSGEARPGEFGYYLRKVEL